MTMWNIGQMIVCVESPNRQVDLKENLPTKGLVYTIRGIRQFPNRIGPSFVLEEIHNVPRRYIEGMCELHFHRSHFRPVRTTNIDVFTSLLSPADRNVSV